MQSVLSTSKKVRRGPSKLWLEYISNDRSIYQTAVLPILRRTLFYKPLYKKMSVYTYIVISVLMIQKLFWMQFGFSFLRAVVVISFLTTLLWLCPVSEETTKDEH